MFGIGNKTFCCLMGILLLTSSCDNSKDEEIKKPEMAENLKKENQDNAKVGTPPSISQTVADLQVVMDQYYRTEPRAYSEQVNKNIKSYNEWVASFTSDLKNKKQKLDKQKQLIKNIEKEIKGKESVIKQIKTDSMSPDQIQTYNSQVTEVNGLIKKHKQLCENYNKNQQLLIDSVEDFKKKQTKYGKEMEEWKSTAEKNIDMYGQWHNSENSTLFFKKINEMLSELHNLKQQGINLKETEAQLCSIREIRNELGEFEKKCQDKKENGLIIVKAKLCGKENAHFIVDTGASTVTIPMQLIEVLGLKDKLGKEITLNLAAGIKIKGREVIIPEMSVYGQSAKQVKAVVVPPSTPGVDGLLGHTFLNQFDYHIDRTTNPKLKLNPKTGNK